MSDEPSPSLLPKILGCVGVTVFLLVSGVVCLSAGTIGGVTYVGIQLDNAFSSISDELDALPDE